MPETPRRPPSASCRHSTNTVWYAFSILATNRPQISLHYCARKGPRCPAGCSRCSSSHSASHAHRTPSPHLPPTAHRPVATTSWSHQRPATATAQPTATTRRHALETACRAPQTPATCRAPTLPSPNASTTMAAAPKDAAFSTIVTASPSVAMAFFNLAKNLFLLRYANSRALLA